MKGYVCDVVDGEVAAAVEAVESWSSRLMRVVVGVEGVVVDHPVC
jgi:hypothetical protein